MAFSLLFAGCKKTDSIELTDTDDQPELMYSVSVTAPSLTKVLIAGSDYNEEDSLILAGSDTSLYYPSPLTLIFEHGTENPNITPGMLDKGLVKLSLAIEGDWDTNGGDTVYFYPAIDWPADTEFTITIDENLLPSDYKLNTYAYDFKTPNFEVMSVQSFSLIEDGQFGDHYAVAIIYFSHQVDQDSVKNGISLMYDNQKIDFTVDFDKTSRFAFIKSSSFKPGIEAGPLTLEGEIKALLGDTLTEIGPLYADVSAESDFWI
jgi:hypothetical protein